MEPMGDKIFAFNKAAFEKTFSLIFVMQDETEKMVNASLEKMPWFPEPSKKAILNMISACRKGCKEFKEAVDESVFGKSPLHDYYAQWFGDK